MFHKVLKPMLLKEVDKLSLNNDYLYELKFDGIRSLIYVSKDTFKIYSRNSNDLTNIYPELLSIQKLVGNNEVIFDGEIVAFANNLPSFRELQKRSHLKNNYQIAKKSKEIPVCFIAFDCLYNNKNIMDKPLSYRKNILNKYEDSMVFIKAKTYQNGKELFKKVKELGMEGIVAKEKTSIYIPNKRVDYWLKIKNFLFAYFFIHGYIKLKDKYRLFLGEYIDNKLFFVGNVSVSKDDTLINKLRKAKKVNNQFINAKQEGTYIEPIYKIKVYYLERTSNNHLRQPFIRNKKKL